MDDARRRLLPDDEESVASRTQAATLLRAWAPFRFAGRVGRGGYLMSLIAWHVACAIGTGIAFTVVLLLAGLFGGDEAVAAVALPGLVVVAAVYVAGLVGYAVRRLHDLGRSGAWVVLGFVPLVGIVFGLALLFAPGAERANVYGEAPPKPVAVTHEAVGTMSALVAESAAERDERLDEAYAAGRRYAERRQSGA
ncbi:MAG: DUF805 domain-containing protein [Trueperaceae bacterium]